MSWIHELNVESKLLSDVVKNTPYPGQQTQYQFDSYLKDGEVFVNGEQIMEDRLVRSGDFIRISKLVGIEVT